MEAERPAKKFKNRLLWVFLLIFFGAVFPPGAAAEYFVIDEFQSHVAVRRDSSLLVQETIQVTFSAQRHGIFREIPFRYSDRYGKTLETPIRVISVTNAQGQPWDYRVSRRGNVVHIRIGDPQAYVAGVQVYKIDYEVENALLFLDDHDELYWNVTGNFWKTSIARASATVSLPGDLPAQHLWSACFTGVMGSATTDCRAEKQGNGAAFQSAGGLKIGEGLTVRLGWEKGLVAEPSAWKRFWWRFNWRENWVFLLPPAVFLAMFRRWYAVGRDPRVKEAVTVQYNPPQLGGRTLCPGEVGCLVDERLDPRDITSTIVGLAVKGYMKIQEVVREGLIFDTTDYKLLKLKEPDDALGRFEKELMSDLFPFSSTTISVSGLKNNFYKHLKALRQVLYEDLVRMGCFQKSPDQVRTSYVIWAFVMAGVGGAVTYFFTSDFFWKSIVAWILAGGVVLGFSRVMPAKTRSGAAAAMEILGFREFLNRAEKDRIERMGQQDLYSRFLPYAIALDVADNWSEAFEGVYQEPARWYESSRGIDFSHRRDFHRSINSMTGSLGSAVFSAPRGEGVGGGGLGGGGSSGGGFGGGGGGSW